MKDEKRLYCNKCMAYRLYRLVNGKVICEGCGDEIPPPYRPLELIPLKKGGPERRV